MSGIDTDERARTFPSMPCSNVYNHAAATTLAMRPHPHVGRVWILSIPSHIRTVSPALTLSFTLVNHRLPCRKHATFYFPVINHKNLPLTQVMIVGHWEDECLKQKQTWWRASFIPLFAWHLHMAMVMWQMSHKAQTWSRCHQWCVIGQ